MFEGCTVVMVCDESTCQQTIPEDAGVPLRGLNKIAVAFDENPKYKLSTTESGGTDKRAAEQAKTFRQRDSY